MSVYTVVTPTEAANLLAHYDLGQLLRLEGIASGMVNTNYRLDTERTALILTLIENPAHGQELPYLIHLLRHLANQGIPCPVPVADREGQVLHLLHQRPALLVTLLPGSSPQTPTVAQSTAIGNLLARIHQAGEGFTLRRPNPLGPPLWSRLLQRLATTNAVPTGLLAHLQTTLDNCRAELFAAELPSGVCHADLFPDNTLFQGEHLSGVIDFYYAGHERRLLDLAITLNAWGFDSAGNPRLEILSALWEAYTARIPLTQEELRLLNPALQAASLRFALTRLDARHFPREGATVTRKPPEEYLQRLGFHQEHRPETFLPVPG